MSFRLAGFRAVRITSYWRPGLTRPTDDELRILRNVGDAAARNGVRVYVTVMSPGSATTPLTDEARGDFASYAAALVREAPSIAARHRRKRAQPQPLLATAVRAGRDECVARGLPDPSLGDLRRAEGRVAGRPGLRWRGLAARQRPTWRLAADPLADEVRAGARHRLSSERPRPAGDGRVRHPPVRRQLEPVAGDRPSGDDDDRHRRLREARRAARRGVRRNGTARFGAADLLRRVRRRVGHPVGESLPLHRGGARRDASRERDDAGRVLRAGARARLLPADGRRRPAVPLTRRARAPRLAVGNPLHGRDAEVEQATRDGVARPHDRRLDHALPRRGAAGAPVVPPVRHPLGREARRSSA